MIRSPLHCLLLSFYLQLDINQLMMTSVNVSQSLSPIHRPMESPGSSNSSGSSSSSSSGGGGGVGGPVGAAVEQSPVDRTKGFFPDESEPLLRCDSTSSKDSALSRNGSFITKGKELQSSKKKRKQTNKMLLFTLLLFSPSKDHYFPSLVFY